MSATETTREWIDYAERDYETARFLMSANRIPCEIVAFQCQQAVEKYLKAVLVQANEKVPYIHDLALLNRKARVFLPELESIEEICERMTPYGTLSRYPQRIFFVTEGMLPIVLQWTEKARSIVRIHLEEEP
jgi:HEPN domain-containing protein